MGRDWNEPRDKGPQIDEPTPKHKRSRKHKPYAIERRYVKGFLFKRWRDWFTYKKYETEQDRDKALEVLQRKDSIWQYRKKEM